MGHRSLRGCSFAEHERVQPSCSAGTVGMNSWEATGSVRIGSAWRCCAGCPGCRVPRSTRSTIGFCSGKDRSLSAGRVPVSAGLLASVATAAGAAVAEPLDDLTTSGWATVIRLALRCGPVATGILKAAAEPSSLPPHPSSIAHAARYPSVPASGDVGRSRLPALGQA